MSGSSITSLARMTMPAGAGMNHPSLGNGGEDGRGSGGELADCGAVTDSGAAG
jgi:hypothetical protein